jgi:glycosyltransferase involved in cell wall biosynthesis
LALAKQIAPDCLSEKLHIFGGLIAGSDTGSKFEQKRYLSYLKALAKVLGLQKDIVWYGARSSSRLWRSLSKKPYVFVSASLFGMEDFGVAAYRSLAAGNRAVLTRWGGHIDHGKSFKGMVELVPIEFGNNGPFVNPRVFAAHILQALDKTERTIEYGPNRLTANLSKDQLLKTVQLAIHETRKPRSIKPTSVAKSLRACRFPRAQIKFLKPFFNAYSGKENFGTR